MGFLESLATQLQTDGVGTYGTNIFVSSKATIPAGSGPYMTLIETGGIAPIRTHSDGAVPAYQRPQVQVMARAASYAAAKAMVENAYASLVALQGATVGLDVIIQMTPIQEPFDLGVDEANRARVVVNFAVLKRRV